MAKQTWEKTEEGMAMRLQNELAMAKTLLVKAEEDVEWHKARLGLDHWGLGEWAW